MKALTIRQPWASLIAAGVKTIETRSWSTKYRGPIAIHAGKHPVETNTVGYWWEGNYPLGAVVATCTLADVVPIVEDSDMSALAPYVRVMRDTRLALRRTDAPSWPEDITNQLPFGDFTPGRYAWLLTDITPCNPQPAKGRQGPWDWEAS